MYTNTLKTQSHVSWDYTYHLVIVPKYRKRVLFEKERKEIGKILRDLAKRKEVEIIE